MADVIEITFPREYRLLWAVGIEFAAKTQHRLIVKPFVYTANPKADRVICGAYAASPTLSRWRYIGFREGGGPYGFRTDRRAHSFPWPAEARRVSELTADLAKSLETHIWKTHTVRDYKFVDWGVWKDRDRAWKNLDGDLLALRQLVDFVTTERRYAPRRRKPLRARTAHSILDQLVARYAPHLL